MFLLNMLTLLDLSINILLNLFSLMQVCKVVRPVAPEASGKGSSLGGESGF